MPAGASRSTLKSEKKLVYRRDEYETKLKTMLNSALAKYSMDKRV